MNDFAAFAPPIEAALRSLRPEVLAAFAAPPSPERRKVDGSPVTSLDLLLEARLSDALLALEPSFGVRGEESGVLREGRPMWHVDPLDGTANFERRLPLFASQLVLMDGATPLFAAVYEPFGDTVAWAARGAGAWIADRKLEVPDRALADAHVAIDIADDGLFMARPDLVSRIRAACYRVRSFGSSAIHFRGVATGGLGAFVGGRAEPTALHDLGPGLLLIREAGGVTTDGAGGDPLVTRHVVIAASPRCHDALVALLST